MTIKKFFLFIFFIILSYSLYFPNIINAEILTGTIGLSKDGPLPYTFNNSKYGLIQFDLLEAKEDVKEYIKNALKTGQPVTVNAIVMESTRGNWGEQNYDFQSFELADPNVLKSLNKDDKYSIEYKNTKSLPHTNIGLYGFYIGETLKDCIISLLEKSKRVAITVLPPYAKYYSFLFPYDDNRVLKKIINNRGDNIKPRLNDKISLNTITTSAFGIQEQFSAFSSIFNEFKIFTIKNINNANYNQSSNPYILTNIDCVLENDMLIKMWFIKDTNNYFQSKLFMITIPEIKRNVAEKMLDVLKDRYGEFSTMNYPNSEYKFAVKKLDETYIIGWGGGFGGIGPNYLYFLEPILAEKFIKYYILKSQNEQKADQEKSLEGI